MNHQQARIKNQQSGDRPLTPDPEDQRLAQALEEYLAALEAGHGPNREEFLHRFPAIAGPLAECIDGLEFVNGAAAQVALPMLDQPPGVAPAAADVQNGRAARGFPPGARDWPGRDGGRLPGGAALARPARGVEDRSAYHAFLWDSVNGMQDLGTLGGAESFASGINSFGHVVGWSQTADGTGHAFLWDSMDGTQDLGTLPGYASSLAYGINESGQVVGSSYSSCGHPIATLYQDGAIVNLNDLIPAGSRWTLQYAKGINDAGQIVGTGSYQGGYWPRSYLLTPDDSESPPGGSHFRSPTALGVALPHDSPAIVQTITLSSRPLSAPVPQQRLMETQPGQRVQSEAMPISLAAARYAHDAAFENSDAPLLDTWAATGLK